MRSDFMKYDSILAIISSLFQKIFTINLTKNKFISITIGKRISIWDFGVTFNPKLNSQCSYYRRVTKLLGFIIENSKAQSNDIDVQLHYKIPILKSGDKNYTSNYRSIFILSTLSQIRLLLSLRILYTPKYYITPKQHVST